MASTAFTLGACLTLAGAAAAVALWPSCEPRHRRPRPGPGWAEVVRSAAPTVDTGDATLLGRAVELYQADGQVDEQVEAVTRKERDRLPLEELGEPAREALDALVAWHEERGGLPERSCPGAMGDGLAWLKLAKLALAVAEPRADDPHLLAALYLGHRLRGEGVNLLDGAIGVEIATYALRWSQEHGVAPGAAFVELRPTRAELRRTLAAEAICSEAMLAQVREGDAGAAERIAFAAHFAGRDFDELVDGEIAAVRRYHEEVLREAGPLLDDPAQLGALLDRKRDAAGDAEQHPILHLVVGGSHAVVEMAEKTRDYDAFLARAHLD